jgi:cation-transporting ATPase 13A3/4/5
MQNKLKEPTAKTIEVLNKAGIRTIMATGDNALTAVAIGRQCNIIRGDVDTYQAELVHMIGSD